ncbi:MAG: BamA/TamA family outer membrane protein [Paludibacteraceae bacterium]|nr:BamA/TamA family outer membrane protein [Paludibacteraceae bacterium]
MKRHLVIGILLVWANLFGWSVAQGESIQKDVEEVAVLNWPVMAVPVVNYTPETGWEFGAAAQAYFKLFNPRTSIIQVDGAYSLNRQWYANLQGTLYMGTLLPWMLQFRAGYRNYPDVYYGIGNQPDRSGTYARLGTHYESQRAYAFVQPLVHVGKDWYIGPHAEVMWENTLMQGDDESTRVLMPGIGITAQFDTRDVVYYPSRGMFFKASITHYNRWWGATSGLTRGSFNWRQFIPFGKYVVWCYEVRADMALSLTPKNTPFQMLPTFGGQDLVRGIPYGMFRDNTMLAVQTELRFPIWRWIRACVFAGMGDVNDYTHWQWARPKVGYGLGLRLTINKAKVNIRADVARNNIFPSWLDINGYGFYLTATEAF